MGLTKPIEQYLFSNLLIRIHVFMYLKDIIRGMYRYVVTKDYDKGFAKEGNNETKVGKSASAGKD